METHFNCFVEAMPLSIHKEICVFRRNKQNYTLIVVKYIHIVYFSRILPLSTVTVAITAASCQVLGEDNSIAPTPWCFLRADLGHETMIYWHYGACITWELATYLVTTVLYLSLKFKMVRHFDNYNVHFITR